MIQRTLSRLDDQEVSEVVLEAVMGLGLMPEETLSGIAVAIKRMAGEFVDPETVLDEVAEILDEENDG